MSKRRADPRRARRSAPLVEAPGLAPAPAPAADRAAIALWVALALLAAARAAFSFVPGAWLWPLGLHRFLPPVLGWGLWLLAALALAPPLARRAAPLIERLGDAITRTPALATAGWALAAAALAWPLPDRVRFVGDFLLRQGTVEMGERPGVLFPQALPLDLLLHHRLPLLLTSAELMDANAAARLLGAVDVALLGAASAAFARTLALRGGAAVACASVVLFGGYLGMFTGYSKAFAEMCVLVAVAGAAAIAALRTGRGLLTLGVAAALGITLHRSALAMYPALVLVWGLWLAGHGRAGGWRRPGAIAGFAVPLATLAVMAPRIVATVLHTDTAVHFVPPEVRAQGGALAAALSGTRPWDLASLVLMLSPLALATPALLVLLGRRAGRGVEPLVLAALAVPFLAVMPFIHPAHGLFRDWDDFAATGVALSLLAAWWVGEILRQTRRLAWLAAAVMLGVAVPAVQWLVVHADTDRGLQRVRAFVEEPPVRPDAQRGTTWDYLGIRNFRLARYAEAQAAFARAAETTPSPRVLEQWALAATMTGDLRTAQQAYRRVLEKHPDNDRAWLGLLAVSMRQRDWPEAKRAALALQGLVPGNSEAQRALDDIARQEARPAERAGGAR